MDAWLFGYRLGIESGHVNRDVVDTRLSKGTDTGKLDAIDCLGPWQIAPPGLVDQKPTSTKSVARPAPAVTTSTNIIRNFLS